VGAPATMGTVTYDTRVHWEGWQARRLLINRCGDCGTWIHFPRRLCPDCWSENVTPEPVDGSGRLVSWSLPRTPPGAPPVVTGVVALDAAPGARILAQVTGVDPDELTIGMALELGWRDEHGHTVPEFHPIGASS